MRRGKRNTLASCTSKLRTYEYMVTQLDAHVATTYADMGLEEQKATLMHAVRVLLRNYPTFLKDSDVL